MKTLYPYLEKEARNVKKMQWLEQLHREHYGTLLRLARHRLYDSPAGQHEAEDVVQEAFLLAGEKDIRTHEAPLGWLLQTVEHLCRQRIDKALRAAQRQQRLAQQLRLDESAPPQEQPSEKALLSEMEGSLPEKDWALLQLYCLEGLPVEEIARQNGLSVGAVRVRIHRIRTRLKKSFPAGE